MSEMRTIYLDKPCPFCGCNVELFEMRYPNGEHGWMLAGNLGGECVCNHVSSLEPEEVDGFVAAWNNAPEEV